MMMLVAHNAVHHVTSATWKKMKMSSNEINPDYLSVCSALKKVRLLKGHTLESVELATNGEFTKEALGSYERNSRSISVKRLLRLCEFYQVSVGSVIQLASKELYHELRTTA